nr:hypothetical protein [Afipia sp.]
IPVAAFGLLLAALVPEVLGTAAADTILEGRVGSVMMIPMSTFFVIFLGLRTECDFPRKQNHQANIAA